MIFVILGSQKFQFDRLLKALDSQIEKGMIEGDVFAQTGYSGYRPKHFQYRDFLNRDEFEAKTAEADLIITHGGTGAILGAVQKGKKVIAVPRLSKYGEHVDDHQIEVISALEEQNIIASVTDCNLLFQAVSEIAEHEFTPYVSNTGSIIESIDHYIQSVIS